MAYWLAIGPAESWEIGIKEKVWAVSHHNAKAWEKVQPGDLVCFYATAPVKGIIGIAKVQSTRCDETPFWPQEAKAGASLWPFRILLQAVKALPRSDWETRRVELDRTGIVMQKAFQPLAEEKAKPIAEPFAKPKGTRK
jgi:hypothetical protein